MVSRLENWLSDIKLSADQSWFTLTGGFKMSGQGHENGEAALEQYTETRTVAIKLG